MLQWNCSSCCPESPEGPNPHPGAEPSRCGPRLGRAIPPQVGFGTLQPLLLPPLLSLCPNTQQTSREGRVLGGSQGWERCAFAALLFVLLPAPPRGFSKAADVRAKAKQRSELTALHLPSARREAINRNNHPGAAASPGGEQGSSSPADAGQGDGATFNRGSDSKRQMNVKKSGKGGSRQSLGSFPPHQALGRFFRRD